MPDFEYRGPSPGAYPMLRDAYGVLAGTVTPGDVLEFDRAPDADWVAYEGGDNDDRSEQGQGAGGEQHEDEQDDTGTDQGDDEEAGTGQEEADQ